MPPREDSDTATGASGGPTGVTLPGAPAHCGFLEDSRVLLLVESVVKL